MPVGATIGRDQMDNMITSGAVHLREVMQDISQLSLSVNGQGTGLAYLQSLGTSSVPNPDNPIVGGVHQSDAQYALSMISYENTVASVYFGTATQASTFNFNQQLSALWNKPISTGSLSPLIAQLAAQLRDVAQVISNLNLSVNGQAQGLAYLASVGYSNAANPANHDSISDAALALETISYLNTPVAVYFGTASQASTFNFNQQLSGVWAGHVTV